MRWTDFAPEQRHRIVDAAATRLATEDAAAGAPDERTWVTMADLADFARGRQTRCGQTALQHALHADRLMRDAFDLLVDRYALISLPPAIAASSGDTRRRRRSDAEVEIEWAASTAEPDTVFVRVYAPAAMRPVRHLMLRADDGTVCRIPLADDGAGDVVETLVERHSLEFTLLQSEAAKLWLQ